MLILTVLLCTLDHAVVACTHSIGVNAQWMGRLGMLVMAMASTGKGPCSLHTITCLIDHSGPRSLGVVTPNLDQGVHQFAAEQGFDDQLIQDIVSNLWLC